MKTPTKALLVCKYIYYGIFLSLSFYYVRQNLEDKTTSCVVEKNKINKILVENVWQPW